MKLETESSILQPVEPFGEQQMMEITAVSDESSRISATGHVYSFNDSLSLASDIISVEDDLFFMSLGSLNNSNDGEQPEEVSKLSPQQAKQCAQKPATKSNQPPVRPEGCKENLHPEKVSLAKRQSEKTSSAPAKSGANRSVTRSSSKPASDETDQSIKKKRRESASRSGSNNKVSSTREVVRKDRLQKKNKSMRRLLPSEQNREDRHAGLLKRNNSMGLLMNLLEQPDDDNDKSTSASSALGRHSDRQRSSPLKCKEARTSRSREHGAPVKGELEVKVREENSTCYSNKETHDDDDDDSEGSTLRSNNRSSDRARAPKKKDVARNIAERSNSSRSMARDRRTKQGKQQHHCIYSKSKSASNLKSMAPRNGDDISDNNRRNLNKTWQSTRHLRSGAAYRKKIVIERVSSSSKLPARSNTLSDLRKRRLVVRQNSSRSKEYGQ